MLIKIQIILYKYMRGHDIINYIKQMDEFKR